MSTRCHGMRKVSPVEKVSVSEYQFVGTGLSPAELGRVPVNQREGINPLPYETQETVKPLKNPLRTPLRSRLCSGRRSCAKGRSPAGERSAANGGPQRQDPVARTGTCGLLQRYLYGHLRLSANGARADRGRADGTAVLVQLPVGKYQQQPFTDRPRRLAAGTVKFRGLQVAEGGRGTGCAFIHGAIINKKAVRKQSRTALEE